jgi:hypothetical protein
VNYFFVFRNYWLAEKNVETKTTQKKKNETALLFYLWLRIQVFEFQGEVSTHQTIHLHEKKI